MLKSKALRLLVGIFGFASLTEGAFAQNFPNPKFKRVSRETGELKIKNCALIAGVKKFQVFKKGKKIRPDTKAPRKAFTFPEKYTFFSCVQDEQGPALYAKKSANGIVARFAFVEDDFPNNRGGGSGGGGGGNGISSACPGGTRGFGFGTLYKPAADASDNRRGKPAVLFTGSAKTRTPALRIFASNGAEVCRFTFKASSLPGVNGGADHYFSGWSGGCGLTGSQIASAARSASGSSDIYVEWKGGQCLGPVNPAGRFGGI